jgi:hypothetical protein
MLGLRRRLDSILGNVRGGRVQDVMLDRDSSKSSATSQANQILLRLTYQSRIRSGEPMLPLAEVEFRAFSQNGEDGILLYLFSLLSAGGRRVVEICAGDGRECNSANLLINHGWSGLLFDGDKTNVERGRQFYEGHPDTHTFPPRWVSEWVTRENVNELIQNEGFDGEIDLLSLDIDGNDYWIWEAIEAVQPRVVVAEIQCIWSNERSVTVPYDPQFRARYVDGFGIYSGASLPAFVKLAARKGYRFVGVQRLGFNAFFVRNGIAEELIPEADPRVAMELPFVRWATKELLPLVKDMAWEDV